MSLLCRLKNLVHKGILKEKDLERIVIIPKDQQSCDCINRAELIGKTIKRNSIWLKITDSRGMNLQEIINELPSIQPKPKTGHWIAIENEEMETVGYYCSECDLPMETEQRTDFCPNCGAKMLSTDQNCDSCKNRNEVDGSNCYECVKGIRNNYKAKSEDKV